MQLRYQYFGEELQMDAYIIEIIKGKKKYIPRMTFSLGN